MTDIKIPFTRRKLLKMMLAAPVAASGILGTSTAFGKPATSAINTTGLAVTDDTVKCGILHSLTGTMAISETGSVEAETLAIEQINAMGGILGRQIEIITEDGASDWPTFAERARKLLRQDKVASIMGCWTSASRKAVLPVLERENGLLYYPTFYEGLEQSPNVIYTGQEATQQILASLDWLWNEKGIRTFYLVGSDYIWPRTSMKIARIHIEKVLGGQVVGEDYAPLGHTSFGSLINRIRLRRPDAIFAAVVGGSNVAFFRQLNSAGLNGKTQTLLSLATTEDEVLGIGGENVEGFFSSMKYFQSLDNENNIAFVKAFKERWGDDSVIGDVTQAAYLGPWLWKEACERAGSFDVVKVTAASPGIQLTTAPEGFVEVHPNHHLWSKTRIGEWRRDGQADVVWESDLIEPNPFPEGYQ
jgi:urea transport system substrate-binding protein